MVPPHSSRRLARQRSAWGTAPFTSGGVRGLFRVWRADSGHWAQVCSALGFVSSTAGGDLWVVGCTSPGSARIGRGALPLIVWQAGPVGALVVGRFGCFARILSACRKRTHDFGE